MSDSRSDYPAEDDACDAAVFSREALPAGTRFGEMEILHVVAVGGFGIVYQARDHLLDREVAIKEFMPEQMARRGEGANVVVRRPSYFDIYQIGLRSFVNEAKLLAHFNHPAMVKVYRFWEANGTGYMVMPYLRGPTLHQLRRAMSQPPTEAWLRSIIDPLLDALAMLHAEGIYHRDIAPDNVLLPGTAAPVLLDFGAARRQISDHTQRLTAVLKPGFAPIEQYAEATHLRQGPWTDVYALAAVVAYLLDAVAPPASTARSIHDEMPVLAHRTIPGVSKQFLAAIDWALAVRPQDRPAGIAQWRLALDRRIAAPAPVRLEATPVASAQSTAVIAIAPTIVLPRAEVAAPKPKLAPATAPRVWRWSRHGMAWAAAAGLVTLAVGAGLQVSVNEPGREEPGSPRAVAVAAARPVNREPVEEGVLASARSLPSPSPAVTGLQPALLTERAERAPPTVNKPVLKRKPGRKLNSQTARLAATPGPREACSGRFFLAQPACFQRLCGEPRYKRHPQCTHSANAAELRRRNS